MKKITETITAYAKEFINSENDWYSWREINEEKLPNGVELPIGNQYLKNLVLKQELNNRWKNSGNSKEKFELIKYYIATWGGIHTNSQESMNEYSNLSARELIKKGKKGIASWSKAIVIHDPNKYAIFDARVAISLNCIQKLYNIENKVLFPVLSSRNKVVARGNKLIKESAKLENWKKANEETFYNQYLEILENVADEFNTNVSTVEMLLFAKAEELVKETYRLN